MADALDETPKEAQSSKETSTNPTPPDGALPSQTAPLPDLSSLLQDDTTDAANVTPSLRDVRSVLRDWLRGRAHALRSAFGSQRFLVPLVVAVCVIGAAAVLYSVWDGARTPPREVVEAYVRDHLHEPPHAAETEAYLDEEAFSLDSIEIVDARPSSTRRDACDVQVALVYTSSTREARVDEQLTYVRTGESWNCTASTAGTVSYRALAGVSHQRVVERLPFLLEAADDALGEDGSLASLYQGGTADVVDEQFDPSEQTDQLSLRCTAQHGFATYTCGLTALFRFVPASGAWELDETTASEGFQDPSYDALTGAWQGTFSNHQAQGARCLAAREHGLTLSVSEVSGTPSDGMSITGTVSGVAHAHATLDQEREASEGDVVLEEAAFAGSLASADNGALVFDCSVTLPDGTSGTEVALTLSFGLPDDPAGAQAVLSTTQRYQTTFLLFTFDQTARFTDTYALERAA